MQAVSFGPHRGADWLNRVALDLGSKSPGCERFTLIAQDPKHPRTLWVSLSLTGSGHGRRAACAAIYIDASTGEHWLAQESWPLDRVRVDPYRGGVGVGECSVGDGHSHGLIRGESFAIGWSIDAPYDGAPVALLPHPWWYGGNRLGAKAALTAPAHAAAGGHIEIWRSLGRYADKARIDCRGWSISQSHVFGAVAPVPYVHLHVPPISGQSFDLFALGSKIFGLWPTTVLTALAVPESGAQPARAHDWRYGGILPTPATLAAPWQFTVQHNGATWRGEVLAVPGKVVQQDAGTEAGCAIAVAVGVTVQASITAADGQLISIASNQAVVEVGGALPAHA